MRRNRSATLGNHGDQLRVGAVSFGHGGFQLRSLGLAGLEFGLGRLGENTRLYGSHLVG